MESIDNNKFSFVDNKLFANVNGAKHEISNLSNIHSLKEINTLKAEAMKEKNILLNILKKTSDETEKEYLMDVEIPGFDKKEIALSLEKGYLTISAEKKECADGTENYVRRERSCRLSRTYYVGDVNKESIKAKYESGVLEITIPKQEKEIPVAHNIEID